MRIAGKLLERQKEGWVWAAVIQSVRFFLLVAQCYANEYPTSYFHISISLSRFVFALR